MSRALAVDPEVVEAHGAVEAARVQEGVAGAWLHENPSLGAHFQTGEVFGLQGREIETTLTQVVEVAGQQGLRRRLAQERTRLALAVLRQRRAEVRARAIQSHVDLFVAQERFRLSQELSGLARRAADSAPKRMERGDLSVVDATLLEAEALRSRGVEQQELLKLHRAQAALGRWLQAEPSSLRAAAPPPWEGSERQPMPACAEHVQRAVADAEVNVASAERRLLDREWVPSPSVGLGFKLIWLGSPDLGNEQVLVATMGLPLPFFDRKRVARAEAFTVEQVKDEERAVLQRTLPLELEQARERLEQAARIEKDTAALRPKLRDAFERIEAAFLDGQLGWSDYQVKRNALLEAGLDGVEALRERVTAWAEYQRLCAGTEVESP